MSVPNITVTPEKFQLVLGVNDDITISLTNVGFEAVLYRLLTTAPERYVVKHTKGVIKGNSTAKIAITLNPKHIATAAAQQPADGGKIIKDDFRLEYAVQSAEDVIEPRASNVPQLIKDKKAANPSAVLKKMLRCHVLLDAADAAATVTNPSSVGGGESASRGDNIRLSAKQMQENTLLERNKRKEGGGGTAADLFAANNNKNKNNNNNSNIGASGNGRLGGVLAKGDPTQRVKVILVILAVLAAGAIWMMME